MGDQRPVTNRGLAALIAEAGMTHAALARQVALLGQQRHGLDLRYDSVSVNRWLRGAVPAPPTPALAAEVLGRKIDRPVDAEALFDAGDDFLQFPADVPAAVDAATALWRHAVRRRDLLIYPLLATAGHDAGWRWCFTPVGADVASSGVRQA